MALHRSRSSVSHDTTGKVSYRQGWSRKRSRSSSAFILALFPHMQTQNFDGSHRKIQLVFSDIVGNSFLQPVKELHRG